VLRASSPWRSQDGKSETVSGLVSDILVDIVLGLWHRPHFRAPPPGLVPGRTCPVARPGPYSPWRRRRKGLCRPSDSFVADDITARGLCTGIVEFMLILFRPNCRGRYFCQRGMNRVKGERLQKNMLRHCYIITGGRWKDELLKSPISSARSFS
jgi:hypothetical protein